MKNITTSSAFVKPYLNPNSILLELSYVSHETGSAHHHPLQSQCYQYLSCYLPHFDHLEWVPIFMVTFVKATFVLATFVHIRNISADTDPILTKH